jgi:hypothetical protein
VTGDGADQVIDGSGLDHPAFAEVILRADAAGGDDTLIGSRQTDWLAGGIGHDRAVLPARGPGDSYVEAEVVQVQGTTGDDSITLYDSFSFTSWTPTYYPTISWADPAPVSGQVLFTSRIEIWSGAGDDTILVTAWQSAMPRLTIDGGAGDDTIQMGHQRIDEDIAAGTGANTLRGAAAADVFLTTSNRDTIDGRGGTNKILDRGPRAGGRTILPATNGGTYAYDLAVDGDVGVVRVRPPRAGGSYRFTTSSNRTGQQEVPSSENLQIRQLAANGPSDSTLFDVVAGPRTVLGGKAGSQDLADITIPSGAWGRRDEAGLTVITPDDTAYRAIDVVGMDEVSVHGPWTDPVEGFVHRSVRDLLFTFPDDDGRAQRTAAIKAGTLTRSGFVDEMMGLDAYVGLDVDRVFLKYLQRSADPSGRAYWIRSLQSGKALWRFRAQLFGSNEYFAKAGGTNAAYVEQAYTDVLDRGPDPSGQAYWTSKLDNGADRGSVALQFINSPEARRRLVDDQYLRFLDRLPTAGEQASWVAKLPTASGEQQLVRTLALSSEYLGPT